MSTFLALATLIALLSFTGVFGATTIAIRLGLLPGAKLPWDRKATVRRPAPVMLSLISTPTAGLTAVRTIAPILPRSFHPQPPFVSLTSSAGSTTVAPLAA